MNKTGPTLTGVYEFLNCIDVRSIEYNIYINDMFCPLSTMETRHYSMPQLNQEQHNKPMACHCHIVQLSFSD